MSLPQSIFEITTVETSAIFQEAIQQLYAVYLNEAEGSLTYPASIEQIFLLKNFRNGILRN